MGKQVSTDTELVRAQRATESTAVVQEAVAAKIRPRLSEAAYLEKLVRLGKNSHGDEVPDPTVMEPPIGWTEPPSMVELIRKMIRDHEIEKGFGDQDMESFEEADDFDVGDENAEELRSGWENDFEPEEVKKISEELERKRNERQRAKDNAMSGAEGVEKPEERVSRGKRSAKSKKSLDTDELEEI